MIATVKCIDDHEEEISFCNRSTFVIDSSYESFLLLILLDCLGHI